MMLISFLAILGFYLFAVTAGPLANGGTSDMITITNRTAVGTEYAIRCNGLGLDLNYQQQCISKFFAIGQGTITVPVNGDVHMCSEPGIKISGRALDNNGATQTGQNIAFGTSEIFAACGIEGGSGPAYSDGNFIIHINKKWV